MYEGYEALTEAKKKYYTHAIKSFIKEKQANLEYLSQILRADNDLSSRYVLSIETEDEDLVSSTIDGIKRSANLDYISISKSGEAVVRGSEHARGYLDADLDKASAEHFLIVDDGEGAYLAYVSPLYLYGDQVGVLSIGYSVKDVMAKEVSEITGFAVSFLRGNSSVTDGDALTGKTTDDVYEVTVEEFDGGNLLASFKLTGRSSEEITTDIRNRIFIVGIMSMIVLGALVYVLIKYLFIGNFEKILGIIKEGPITEAEYNCKVEGVGRVRVAELFNLVASIREFIRRISMYHVKIKESAKMASIGKISSHIAHDMRSPLSVLKTYAGLKTSADEDPDVAQLRKSAERSVGKLERMAEDLVDYAKASKLQRSQHQLSGIIYEGSIAEAKKRAEEKGVKLNCAMQGGIFVNLDAYKLERVITNLVNNAVQAIENPSTELRTGGGEVCIAATTEHNGVLKITVKDNGKGIDPEVLPHIFDSFFTKGKKGGSGLGLAYCKQVIEAHGGTIDVGSEIGNGTTFTIKIPNCVQEHAAEVESQPQTESQPQLQSAFSRVLIADDDPEIRRQWQKIIPEHGGTIVHSAKTVKEVEEVALDYSKVDIAIVDYQFYGEDKTGIDLIKHLKAKGVKTVYLCTGFYDNEMIINQAHAAGAVRVLSKPIDPTIFS